MQYEYLFTHSMSTDGNGKSTHFIPGVSRVWSTSKTQASIHWVIEQLPPPLLSLLNILKKPASICENQHQGQVLLLSCKSTVIIELCLYMYTQRSHCKLEDNQKSLSYKEWDHWNSSFKGFQTRFFFFSFLCASLGHRSHKHTKPG